MIGRNDACPCGSGKKFKKCCGKNSVIQLDHLIDADLVRIQGDILRHTLVRYENEFIANFEEHFNTLTVPDEALEILEFYSLTWFATTFNKNGKTPMEEYLNTKLNTISRPRTKEIVQSWRNSYSSVFRTIQVDNGNLLKVEDIFTNETSELKMLDTEDLPQPGDLLIATVLQSQPAVILGTFFTIPASKAKAENIENSVLEMFSASGHGDSKAFMKEAFLEVFDSIMFPDVIDPIQELEWTYQNHRDVAEGFQNFMEDCKIPKTFINLGITLWHTYCTTANLKINKPAIYEAALLYLVTTVIPAPMPFSQKELAEVYGVSAGSISSKYNEMKKVLNQDIEELQEIVS
ncbi:hypothetical protein A8F94_07700 [Bacillus sp. FJAT-27225]|uniref:SEC-C metal-binding domain-containing protein n=1 Tax=Bacillus sp. FJAT-27225 TaxID=1743144 RepID=UPI00080C251C|nr:SEC-C metal-binding domain-containing protein [Bacillus sp. FJAT-27225]OCA87727.1 hypothetical protein A8F94_07700 [Bacillus sp. FJAT-27225]